MNSSFRGQGNKGLMSKNSPNQLSDASQTQKEIKEEVYEDVETILGRAVDDIWEMFDDDGNGTFDF